MICKVKRPKSYVIDNKFNIIVFQRSMWKRKEMLGHWSKNSGLTLWGRHTSTGSGGAPAGYSIAYAGYFNNTGGEFKVADVSRHKAILCRSCNAPNCVRTNCAEPNNTCELTQNEARAGIVPPGTTRNYQHHAMGNLTHNAPGNMGAVTLDQNVDYNGNPRTQQTVVEPGAPQAPLTNLQPDGRADRFVQDHNTELMHTPRANGTTGADDVQNSRI